MPQLPLRPQGPPQGGPPQGGPPQGDPIRDNMSFANPSDLALMQKDGGISKDMTVRDFLSSKGIDVDGPIEQLTQFAQKQVKNATMMGKAQGNMPSPAPAGPPPGEQPGMASILRQGVR